MLNVLASQRDLTDIKCGDGIVFVYADDDAWINTSHYVRGGLAQKFHQAFGMPVIFYGSFSHHPLDVKGGDR
jgi:hypothetical protein